MQALDRYLVDSPQEQIHPSHLNPYTSPTMATIPRDTPTILGLKAAVTGTTLFIAGGMFTTSLQFLPSLIATAQKAPQRSPQDKMESGRLTPQPNSHMKDYTSSLTPSQTIAGKETSTVSYEGYKGAAHQFTIMSKTAFATQVPLELLSILASSYLAYHHYTRTSSLTLTSYKWASVAALLTAVFPLTGGFMVPIDHKIARLGGDEEKVEPFEDAPPDRDMERRNAVEFLTRWNGLNEIRSLLVIAAGGIGMWGLVE